MKFEQKGLPVSQEALFLLDFVFNTGVSPVIAAADLGCGSGMLMLGLGVFYPDLEVTGYEIQEELVETARRNIARNSLTDRLKIVYGDIRDKQFRPLDQSCDLVVSNPPFRKIATGKMSTDDLKRHANHEQNGDLDDFVRSGSISLVHRGILAIVVLPERFPELTIIMEQRKVPAFAVRWVHHSKSSPANTVLVLGKKGGHGGLKVFSPLFVK
ncbi:methyltransferase [bacterium]|nr:methyltransferase [bacterium]